MPEYDEEEEKERFGICNWNCSGRVLIELYLGAHRLCSLATPARLIANARMARWLCSLADANRHAHVAVMLLSHLVY